MVAVVDVDVVVVVVSQDCVNVITIRAFEAASCCRLPGNILETGLPNKQIVLRFIRLEKVFAST